MEKGTVRGETETNEHIREIHRKARENRKVIATHRSRHASRDRRKSLADEISFARSVIVKSDEEREMNYVNSVTRKIIRDSSGQRKQSFANELLFAKNVIIA